MQMRCSSTPAGKLIHVILDNYRPQAPEDRQWLDRHHRFTVHLVQTLSSWLNALRQARQMGAQVRVFYSLVDFQVALNHLVAEHNTNPTPFTWTADPDNIISAVRRGHQLLGSIH